jgi:hypothetical protein
MTAALLLPFAAFLTMAVVLVSVAGLRAWRQWLDLKRLEIAGRGTAVPRTELRELRHRVRCLETLASGIEI